MIAAACSLFGSEAVIELLGDSVNRSQRGKTFGSPMTTNGSMCLVSPIRKVNFSELEDALLSVRETGFQKKFLSPILSGGNYLFLVQYFPRVGGHI